MSSFIRHHPNLSHIKIPPDVFEDNVQIELEPAIPLLHDPKGKSYSLQTQKGPTLT